MTDPAVSLTKPERLKLGALEIVIKRGSQIFVEVGAALAEIREERLYRETHATFEDYCQARWGWSRQRSAQLIQASAVVGTLSTIVDKPPQNEGQARELAKVPEEERADVWREAQSAAVAEGKPPATRHIEDARKRREPEPDPVPAEFADYDPEDDAPDPHAEWERAQKEVERLENLVDSLQAGDMERQVVAWSAKYAQLDGRVRQLTTECNEAKRSVKYQNGLLERIRKALGVERNGEILSAIEALMP